jgi:hypothetical protein
MIVSCISIMGVFIPYYSWTCATRVFNFIYSETLWLWHVYIASDIDLKQINKFL